MRTVDDIYAEMLVNHAAKASLNEADSVSPNAIWRLFYNVCAMAIFVHEKMFEQFKVELDAEIELRRIGSIPWFHSKILEFQYGDDLELTSTMYYRYALIDETKKIIKRAAVIEASNRLIVKVTKDNNTPLSNSELAAFELYLKKIKVAGTLITVYNYNPDLLQIDITISYNPLLINSGGELISDTSIKPVEVATNEYIAGIVFGGQFNVQKYVDALQGATGVTDVLINEIKAKSDAAIIYTSVVSKYTSIAGHFTIDVIDVTYNSDSDV